MRKFITSPLGRSGTTVYTLWLSFLYPRIPLGDKNSPDYKDQESVYWSYSNSKENWSYPIQHTHSFTLFSQAPKDFERLWARRNFFDVATSMMTAEKTDMYHMHCDQDVLTYKEKFKDTKFYFDPDEFRKKLQSVNSFSSQINSWKNNTDTTVIELFYEEHSASPETFYNFLNLPMPESMSGWPIKMVINKYDLIDNLEELVDIYCSTPLALDVEKDIILTKLDSYI